MILINEQALNLALSRPAEAALEEIGRSETETIKSDISVPVVRSASGRVIQRSAPGEPPRLEEGLLHANVSYAVEHDEDGSPVLEITSARPPQASASRITLTLDDGSGAEARGQGSSPASVPQILEGPLDRPYMQPAVDRMSGYILQVFADHYERML